MKIHNKLFLILFSFSLLLVTALVLIIQWSIGKGMIEYVNNKEIQALKPVVTQLENEYKENNNWSTMQGKSKKFGDLLFSKLKDSEFEMTPPLPEPRRGDLSALGGPENQRMRLPPPPDFRREKRREMPERALMARNEKPPTFREQINYALFDSHGKLVVGGSLEKGEYSKTMISIDQVTVGWLGIVKRKKIIDGYELDFIQRQQNYLWIITLTTMLLVALVTLVLARHLAGPIKLIMSGMHKLTQGDYQQKIEVMRQDELGELSRDFNELALTLHENESARKRWLANISHELRTPVAILRGELEAILDGVRQLSKDNVESANDEVKHLQHLINDLQQLTSADIGGMHYRKKTTDIAQWINSEMAKYRSYLAAANIELITDITDVKVNIFSDTTRLCQLFENVINNCIKYAEADMAKISLVLDDDLVRIIIEDDGVGVSDMHLPNLFEHLYRVDSSRNRKTGGSGLGLSICAHIVTAHQGNISAEKSDMGGLAIIIDLPISK